MNQHAERLIVRLALEKHPEGGYYRETYRSEESIPATNLPERFAGGERSFSTAIYFLLAEEEAILPCTGLSPMKYGITTPEEHC
jgi:predicted cupin superfamily sugar epimerase